MFEPTFNVDQILLPLHCVQVAIAFLNIELVNPFSNKVTWLIADDLAWGVWAIGEAMVDVGFPKPIWSAVGYIAESFFRFL